MDNDSRSGQTPGRPEIRIKRIYQEPDPGDGFRVLVDRLWPRGLSKEKAGGRFLAQGTGPLDRASALVRP